MLILIGVAPTAYALNRALPDSYTPAFVAGLGRRLEGGRRACAPASR